MKGQGEKKSVGLNGRRDSRNVAEQKITKEKGEGERGESSWGEVRRQKKSPKESGSDKKKENCSKKTRGAGARKRKSTKKVKKQSRTTGAKRRGEDSSVDQRPSRPFVPRKKRGKKVEWKEGKRHKAFQE